MAPSILLDVALHERGNKKGTMLRGSVDEKLCEPYHFSIRSAASGLVFIEQVKKVRFKASFKCGEGR